MPHIRQHSYIPRVNAVRVLLMAAVVLSVYRVPVRFSRYFALLCEFAPCALFALYGYFALRIHRTRSTKSVLKHSLSSTVRVFLKLLFAYVVLGFLYQWLTVGNPVSWLSLPNLLTWLVFCKWPINLGDSIWMLQCVLYALVVFTLLHRFSHNKVVDFAACGGLMVLGIVFGEMAGIFKMPFYLERNFLTTTIPYMLFGKLLHYAPDKLRNCKSKVLVLLFGGGVVLCAAEALFLRSKGMIDTCQHLIGFLPMTAATLLFAVRGPQKEAIHAADIRLMETYRFMYFLFNPVAEFYFLLSLLLMGFPKAFNLAAGATAIVALVLSFLLARAVGRFRSKRVVIPDEHQ